MPVKRTRWAILVIHHDGVQEYLKAGSSGDGKVQVFASPKRAGEMKEFLLEGIADEVQSVNVVPWHGAAALPPHERAALRPAARQEGGR